MTADSSTGSLPDAETEPDQLKETLVPEDLTGDKLLRDAARLMHSGREVPVLAGIPLFRRLGKGGMGAVYYGVKLKIQREVAVKVMSLPEHDAGAIKRFVREARIGAKIRSKHLVEVFDLDEEKGLHYMVMEYVHGGSAADILKQAQARAQALDETAALEICIAAAQGLRAAHEQGVIHRDIKPANILVPKPNGGQWQYAEAKLSDLGLARFENAGKSVTSSDRAMGTPGYMAPEQVQNARKARKPADIFSLGATLYALLGGQAPFTGESATAILLKTVQEPHTPIVDLRPNVSPVTRSLIDQCLAKDPANRFADAFALLEALKVCRSAVAQPDSQMNAAAQLTVLRRRTEVGKLVPETTEEEAAATSKGSLKPRRTKHRFKALVAFGPLRLVVIFGGVLILLAGAYFPLPGLQHSIFGDSHQTKVTITMVADDYNVQSAGSQTTVPRQVVGMMIDFPMGGAPENTGELQVKDPDGKLLDVFWSPPDKTDDPDRRITRWVFKDSNPVFFPIEFRQGALWNQNRELAYIKLPPVPNPLVAPEPAKAPIRNPKSEIRDRDTLPELAKNLAVKLSKAGVKKLAVLEFMDESGDERRLSGKIGAAGKYLAEQTEILLSGAEGTAYRLIERARLDEVLKEVRFQTGDLVKPDGLKKLGQIEPVDAIVLGIVRRAGLDVYVTLKALGVPDGSAIATAAGVLALDTGLAALFGESYYAPPGITDAEPKADKFLSLAAAELSEHPFTDTFAALPYGVEIVTDGAALPFHSNGREVYVPAATGKKYSIRLTNNSDRTAVIALLVDGLNTIGQRRERLKEARKWVLKAGKNAEIEGWQMGLETAREFVFTEAAESLAARKRFCDNIGLITAVFYRERMVRAALGTGEGIEIASKVRLVNVDYEDVPAAVINIKYDLQEIVTKFPKTEHR